MDKQYNTIRQTVKISREHGCNISEYFIRTKIAEKQIPCIFTGYKYLIEWNEFIEWLNQQK